MKMSKILILAFILCLYVPALAQDGKAAPGVGTDNVTAPAEAVTAPAEAVTAPADNAAVQPAEAVGAEEEVVAEPAIEPPAPMPEEPKNVAEAITAVPVIVSAFKNGEYLVGVSFIIMLLVFAIRMFWTSLPRVVAPWVAIGIGALGGMASSWGSGSTWWQGLLVGIVAGLGAVGSYEVGGKKLLKPKAAT